jgi:hypothetical protein
MSTIITADKTAANNTDFLSARGLAKPTPGFNPRSISFKVIAAYATDAAGKMV